ncbi:MAG: zf-HC2 domain-containing protein [Candidatus Caldatribacteriota bacterium]|nr:zf-HC2 domain-containing protein [Candidatus Caldatribacteriota bacterium]
MNCKEIKKLLNPYIDGILDKDTSTQIKKHLVSCPDCRKEYLEIKEIISSLNILSSQSRPAPATLTKSIMTKITQEEVEIQSSWIDNFKKQISIPILSFPRLSLSFPRKRESIFSFRLLAPVAATAAIIFFAFTFLFNMPATSPVCSSEVQFSLKLGDKANHIVAIAGDFNGWNHENNLLEDSDGDGIWTGTLKLEPGRYEYMFVLDGKEWVPDPNALRFVNDGFGNRNSILEINSCSST